MVFLLKIFLCVLEFIPLLVLVAFIRHWDDLPKKLRLPAVIAIISMFLFTLMVALWLNDIRT